MTITIECVYRGRIYYGLFLVMLAGWLRGVSRLLEAEIILTAAGWKMKLCTSRQASR